MTLLVVDLCHEINSLSSREFVHPIAKILQGLGISLETLHFTEIEGVQDRLGKYDRIVLCGTALKDNSYAERLDTFSWMRGLNRPVLGICAGMQVIGSVFGGRIVPQPSIGLQRMSLIQESPLLGEPREIEGYHLHNYGVTLPENFRLLAGTRESALAFRHAERPIYGILFHPEVRNRWILERFADLDG